MTRVELPGPRSGRSAGRESGAVHAERDQHMDRRPRTRRGWSIPGPRSRALDALGAEIHDARGARRDRPDPRPRRPRRGGRRDPRAVPGAPLAAARGDGRRRARRRGARSGPSRRSRRPATRRTTSRSSPERVAFTGDAVLGEGACSCSRPGRAGRRTSRASRRLRERRPGGAAARPRPPVGDPAPSSTSTSRTGSIASGGWSPRSTRAAHAGRAARRGLGRRAGRAAARGRGTLAAHLDKLAAREGCRRRRAACGRSAPMLSSRGAKPAAPARSCGPSRRPAASRRIASARVEDLPQRVGDPAHRAPRDGRVVAAELLGDVDQPAGVDDEVGRPQDAPRRQQRRRPSSASWLLAAPAIDRGSAGAAPSRRRGRRRARTARARRPRCPARASGATQRAPSCSASARLRGSTSETSSFAPARVQRWRSREPTCPRPITQTRPAAQRALEPKRSQQARIATRRRAR